MAKTGRSKGTDRVPLSRERVLDAAMALADESGLEAVTMRQLAARLGVEAMSLYKHVRNKEDILDGLVELVVSKMELPPSDVGWKEALRRRARSARHVLREHGWAAMILESRLQPGPRRLRLYEAVIDVMRRADFPIGLAHHAMVTMDAFLYGFTLQEYWWSFEPDEVPEVIESLQPAISAKEYPRMIEMMDHVAKRAADFGRRGKSASAGYDADFEFGLELILEGIERTKR